MEKQFNRQKDILETVPSILRWKGLPWLASISVVSLYGLYFFTAHHQMLVNDFFGHVWMAL